MGCFTNQWKPNVLVTDCAKIENHKSWQYIPNITCSHGCKLAHNSSDRNASSHRYEQCNHNSGVGAPKFHFQLKILLVLESATWCPPFLMVACDRACPPAELQWTTPRPRRYVGQCDASWEYWWSACCSTSRKGSSDTYAAHSKNKLYVTYIPVNAYVIICEYVCWCGKR